MSLRSTSRLLPFTTLLFFRWSTPAWPQANVEAHEKQIASLPPHDRAYERFRFWSTQLPPGQSQADLLSQYRGYLKTRGLSEA
jgi:hypothetical protein